MDYKNLAYNEAVARLKFMLAEPYQPQTAKISATNDNPSDNLSIQQRPIYRPQQKSHLGIQRSSQRSSRSSPKRESSASSASTTNTVIAASSSTKLIKNDTKTPQLLEAFDYIKRQEAYIEQMERESKYYRQELSVLLNKVRKVISDNDELTEGTRNDLKCLTDDSTSTLCGDFDRKKAALPVVPNIIYEARISELEADLVQARIDLKNIKRENDELKRKATNPWPATSAASIVSATAQNCELHRKQIELLERDKASLEETIRQLEKSLEQAKTERSTDFVSKRFINDIVQMERSQAELEVKHLRDELGRQHERIRELQHQMSRKLLDERVNAERRYNNQVDQLGGDLSSQWEQVAKLQLDLERQKRYVGDLKRDLHDRNAQIDELKMELKSNRSIFLGDMAQLNAEKHSLEQELASLRLQLDRSSRDHKTEVARLNAEINSLSQRLDRSDADLLHSKREVLRLQDDVANLEKELAYGEMKNEVRPSKKHLDQRISEIQEKHSDTVSELEEMIQSQKQLMDKLTNECKALTQKLEETTLKHNQDKNRLRDVNRKLLERLKKMWFDYKNQIKRNNYDDNDNDNDNDDDDDDDDDDEITAGTTTTTTATIETSNDLTSQKSFRTEIGALQTNMDYLTNRMLNSEHLNKLGNAMAPYKALPSSRERETNEGNFNSTTFGGSGESTSLLEDYKKSRPFPYESILGKRALEESKPEPNYEPNYDTKYEFESKFPNDNDNENLKDSNDDGGKREELQEESALPEPENGNGNGHANAANGGGVNEENAGAFVEPIMPDYNAEYNAYDNYNPEQYDGSAYDQSTYEQQAYGGESQQYDGSQPIYDINTNPATGYDYGKDNYDISTYQYEATEGAGEASEQPAAPTASAEPSEQILEEASAAHSESNKIQTKLGTGQKQNTSKVSPATATAVATATAATSKSNISNSSEVTGRNQSRTGSTIMGSPGSGTASGKSGLSQQSSTASNKK